jgi:hypothetical protein
MYSLDKQSAKLLKINVRTENHGADKVGAIDLLFQSKSGNEVLVEFDPLLRTRLFGKPKDGQEDLDENHLPHLLIPKMLMPIKFDWEGIGYGLTIHWGVKDKEAVEVAECEIGKFAFVLQEGGTVITTFRVQCHPSGKDVGWLYEQQEKDLVVTLTPPTADYVAKGGDE